MEIEKPILWFFHHTHGVLAVEVKGGGIEYDKFDKKADKFTYYDMIGFADAYHSKQLIIADVVVPKGTLCENPHCQNGTVEVIYGEPIRCSVCDK